MDLYFTMHALRRMENAALAGVAIEITREMVESVLANPVWSPASNRNVRYDGIVGGRRLAVVIADPADRRSLFEVPLVITAFWVRDA